jgi:hypothetical protein
MEGGRMGWGTYGICDDHWKEQEGERKPVRIQGLKDTCYICGKEATIYVRRRVEDVKPITRTYKKWRNITHKGVTKNE